MENYQHGYNSSFVRSPSRKPVTVSNAQFATTGGSSHALLTYEDKKHRGGEGGKKEEETLVLRQLKSHGLELNHLNTSNTTE